MDRKTQVVVINRLKGVVEHVDGIVTMLDQECYCVAVIRQIQATQAALAKVSQMILDDHLHTCLITAVRGNHPDEREQALAEIGEVWSLTNR